MARVRQKNTGPELRLRRQLHAAGYRFRLHRKDLPGTPDIVFPGRRKVIFVHGCFWHGHDCRAGRAPSSNLAYWAAKIGANVERDERNGRMLEAAGWRVFVVWQCQLRKSGLASEVATYLDGEPILPCTPAGQA